MEGIELPNSIPNRDLKTRTQPMARALTAPAAPPGLPLPEVQAPSFSFNENWQVFVPQALSLVGTCLQRETSSVAVITTLQELLRVEAADPGAYLLAEYVASRCRIKLRSSLFLKKANPVWHVRRGKPSELLHSPILVHRCYKTTRQGEVKVHMELELHPRKWKHWPWMESAGLQRA
jgi:hypothetical protein